MNSSASIHTLPAQVRVTAWHEGARTVSAIQAIRAASRLGLAEAKAQVERVLAGSPIVVDVDDPGSALALLSALERFGFDAQLVGR